MVTGNAPKGSPAPLPLGKYREQLQFLLACLPWRARGPEKLDEHSKRFADILSDRRKCGSF
jgi:hypothetical protein